MSKTIVIIIIIVLIIIGIYLIFPNNKSNVTPGNTSQTTTTTTPVTQQTTTTTTTTQTTKTSTPVTVVLGSVSVDIRNFSFNPSVLNIKTGTTVTWTNNDSVAHTVTSDSNGLLNSPTLSPGDSFSFTFTNTGSTNYHCNIHTMMRGVVIVQN